MVGVTGSSPASRTTYSYRSPAYLIAGLCFTQCLQGFVAFLLFVTFRINSSLTAVCSNYRSNYDIIRSSRSYYK